MGDLTITPALGYHSGNNHWVYAASIFVPTGYYEPATIDIPARSASVLSFGKNRWAITPTVAYTYFDMTDRAGTQRLGRHHGLAEERNDRLSDRAGNPDRDGGDAASEIGLCLWSDRLCLSADRRTTAGPGADAVRNLTGAE